MMPGSNATHAWRDRAACQGVDIHVFFPPPNMPPSKMARQLCTSCPVRAECLQEALENNERGYWG